MNAAMMWGGGRHWLTTWNRLASVVPRICSMSTRAETKQASSLKFLTVNPNLQDKFTNLVEYYRGKIDHNWRVDPQGVFANNELDLSEIEVYGFDYDYTLAVYKESLHYLIYNLGRDVLISKYRYPEEIGTLEYIPDFAIRGLHYDIETGLLMKIDSFHQIQLGSVYNGLSPVNDQDVLKQYGGNYLSQAKIRGSEDSLKMKQLNDLFSVPEICLLSNVTEYFNRHGIAYNPEILFYDVQSAVQSIHPVMHTMLDDSQIEHYLEKWPEVVKFLERLKNNGKKMFLVTNSPFKFVDSGMKYMMGSHWTELFDVIVAQARKPKFFTQSGKLKPFRRYYAANDTKSWKAVTKLEKGSVYLEGTVSQLMELTGWHGKSILYFGDQIFADLADSTLFHGWRTGAIINELDKEIETLNSETFREGITTLQAVQALVDEQQKELSMITDSRQRDASSAVLDALLDDRQRLRQLTKSMFNKQFGSIFRTHHNPTYFSRRLFRYSDIYMSRVTNLLAYGLNHVFCPRRGALPHEKPSRTEIA